MFTHTQPSMLYDDETGEKIFEEEELNYIHHLADVAVECWDDYESLDKAIEEYVEVAEELFRDTMPNFLADAQLTFSPALKGRIEEEIRQRIWKVYTSNRTKK